MKNRNTGILILIILIFATIFAVIYYYKNQKPALTVQVQSNGKIIHSLELDKDISLTITGISGGSNHLVIQNGQVWIDEATCPDKICEHQGKISETGEMIVCLPNQLLVKITDHQS